MEFVAPGRALSPTEQEANGLLFFRAFHDLFFRSTSLKKLIFLVISGKITTN